MKLYATVSLLVITLFTAVCGWGADSVDAIPPLRPPIAEVPPGTWERFGAWIIMGAGLAMVAFAGGARWALRPRVVAPVPPEVQARKTLEPLRGKPDPGTLGVVTRALRTYLAAVFGLPREELTTSEFIRAMSANPEVGPDLAGATASFLRRCDLGKFAPPAGDSPWDSAAEALNIVDLAEARRRECAPAPEKA
jgi:hypothetical protein